MARRTSKTRSTRDRVRYAVVGAGHIAQVAVLPAFHNARRNSELAAIVSSDAAKRRQLGTKYGVPAYDYERLEDCLAAEEVEAVYIALPNRLHCEYTERAAASGVHVLCEKPMAVTTEECDRMLRAVDVAGVRLMIAYRLHFEAATLSALALARSGRLGELRLFESTFSMQVREGNIRIEGEEGGSPLHDLGVYCIQAARMVFGSEPVSVLAASARGDDPRFREIDEAVSAVLRFPGERLAAFTCSFGAGDVSSYRIVGTKGDLRVEPGYEYAEGLAHQLTVEGRTRRKRFPKRDQFAPQLLHFSDCVRDGTEPEPSGLEGRIDVAIVEALQRAAERSEAVDLPGFRGDRPPSPEQETRRPAVRKPALVRARSGSR